ncbi:hypothetical protein [Vibrio alfacsensis]|uniref:hypothetical protein n=1 Tax=Vibrio TaxID=662 RepID=UPI0040689279
MKVNDKRIRMISDYAKHLEAKWQKKDTVIRRWSPVIQTTRKHQVLSIGKTRKRLNQRVGQCSLVTQTGASELGCTTISVTHQEGKFRIATFTIKFGDEDKNEGFGIAYLIEHNITQAVISRHAIERWLERNDSDDIEAALIDLSTGMTESSLKMMMLKLESENTSFDHLTEYEVKCPSGGMGIIKTSTPDDDSLITREFTLVTYLSEDQLGHWNRDEIESVFLDSMSR